MTRAIVLFLALILSVSLSAQIGISASGSMLKAPDWQTTYEEEYPIDFDNANYLRERNLFLSGYNVGVNYWFRLKKKRVEFFPTITYSQYKTLHDLEADFNLADLLLFQTSFLGAHFDTRIYPFDFGSDCDCPVWSKQNDLLKKGFYIMLSPGVDRIETRLEDLKNHEIRPSLGAGFGLDLGISDFLTVSPFFTARYTSEADGNIFFPNQALKDFSDVWRLMIGFNMNFRLENEYRRR